MKYGNIEVPWTASWTDEDRFELRPCRWAQGKIAVWQPHRPGEGKPVFSKPHMTRQRQAMMRLLCDLCGEPLGPEKISLSQERAAAVQGLGNVPMVVEPLSHRNCAARAPALPKPPSAA